jgi:hypothetical protein
LRGEKQKPLTPKPSPHGEGKSKRPLTPNPSPQGEGKSKSPSPLTLLHKERGKAKDKSSKQKKAVKFRREKQNRQNKNSCLRITE